MVIQSCGSTYKAWLCGLQYVGKEREAAADLD